MLGSLMCEGMGPICLGPKSVTLKKQKNKKETNRKKKIERKEEKGKNASAQISSTSRSRFICGPIELKFGREV